MASAEGGECSSLVGVDDVVAGLSPLVVMMGGPLVALAAASGKVAGASALPSTAALAAAIIALG
jgi:hypothetical protein